MKFYGILPQRKLWVKIAAVALGALAVFDAIVNRNWFYVPFGLIIMFAVFSERKQIISEAGVDLLYIVLGHKFSNLWTWEEILAIHTDSLRSAPNIELHFNKGVINRRIILTKQDAEDAIEFMKEMKSGIQISEVRHK